METKGNNVLSCRLLAADGDRNCACLFTGANWMKQPDGTYPEGCGSYIDVPPIAILFEGQMNAWEERWKQCKEDVQKALKQSRATLFLGAGVSAPAGMPGWQGLISQMTGYALQYRDYMNERPNGDAAWREKRERLLKIEEQLIADKLSIFNGVNVLESGQYIEQLLNDSFKRMVNDSSGGNVDYEPLRAVISAIIQNSRTPEYFLNEWKRNNPRGDPKDLKALASGSSLCAVAYLLQAPGGFRRAVTYNYDPLVQEYLSSIFGLPSNRIITHSEGWNPEEAEDSIDIFHVHGYIPRATTDGTSSANSMESQRIILSEDSYYNTERYEAYNWQNSIQAFYLNRDTCVFVGFSAEDYNFRRILRQMGNNQNRDGTLKRHEHYLFLTIDSIVKDAWMNMCRRHLSEGQASYDTILIDTKILLQQQLDAKAVYWAKKGFYPIWVTIKDIPPLLLSLLD